MEKSGHRLYTDFTLSPPAFPKFFNFIVFPKMKFKFKPHYYYEDAAHTVEAKTRVSLPQSDLKLAGSLKEVQWGTRG